MYIYGYIFVVTLKIETRMEREEKEVETISHELNEMTTLISKYPLTVGNR